MPNEVNAKVSPEFDRDLIDTFQEEWDESYPDEHFKCVPAVTRLIRMAQYASRSAEETLAIFGLTRGEAEVLFALVRNPNEDITPKRLQSLMLVSSAGLTNRLDRLEKKGLLVRLSDPEDRRGTILKPTEEGISLTLKAHAAHVANEARVIACLTETEKTQLSRILKKLILSQRKASGDTLK